MNLTHTPVMLNTVINSLNIKDGGTYVDCTFGRGGHSKNILKKIGNSGKLIAIDKDEEARKYALDNFSKDKRFIFEKDSFSNLVSIIDKHNESKKVNGILLDLGVSSPQLDNPKRGFSFMKEGPIDMRMDTKNKLTAFLWLKEENEVEIANILKLYGEERYAHKIARSIKRAIENDQLKTTTDLSKIISECYPKNKRYKKNPATKSFQAIRIFINKELEELEKLLNECLQVIELGGRIVIISFHSLEDRIVKNFINNQSIAKNVPSNLPIINFEKKLNLKKIRIPLQATQEEILQNIRARSAKIRVAEKI